MGAETIRLNSDDPKITVTALLDEEGSNITGGYGGWEIIARPRRQAVTHWGGRDPFQMDLAIILDGHSDYRRVETDCSRLERLALPHPNPGGEPPVIKLSGAAIPHNDLQWVITGFQWGAAMRDSGGYRTRQHVTIGLLRFVEVDTIQLSASANARGKGGTAIRTIQARQGDTLAKIAARELGDSKRWKEIQKLNPNIRDPNRITPNTDIKIPPKVKK
jgi:hypothetical protein